MITLFFFLVFKHCQCFTFVKCVTTVAMFTAFLTFSSTDSDIARRSSAADQQYEPLGAGHIFAAQEGPYSMPILKAYTVPYRYVALEWTGTKLKAKTHGVGFIEKSYFTITCTSRRAPIFL